MDRGAWRVTVHGVAELDMTEHNTYTHTPVVSSTPKVATTVVTTTIETSPLVQWMSICLPMQGTGVQPLAWKDPTCCGATESKGLEPLLCNKRGHLNEKPAPQLDSSPQARQLGKAHCNEDPVQPKNK